MITCFLFVCLYFSGSTECQILNDMEDIVDKSLPCKKLEAHFKDVEAAKLCILNKITFCEARQRVICLISFLLCSTSELFLKG